MGTGSSRGGSSCLGAACKHSSVSSSNSARERFVTALLKPMAVTAQTSQAPMPLPSPSDI